MVEILCADPINPSSQDRETLSCIQDGNSAINNLDKLKNRAKLKKLKPKEFRINNPEDEIQRLQRKAVEHGLQGAHDEAAISYFQCKHLYGSYLLFKENEGDVSIECWHKYLKMALVYIETLVKCQSYPEAQREASKLLGRNEFKLDEYKSEREQLSELQWRCTLFQIAWFQPMQAIRACFMKEELDPSRLNDVSNREEAQQVISQMIQSCLKAVDPDKVCQMFDGFPQMVIDSIHAQGGCCGWWSKLVFDTEGFKQQFAQAFLPHTTETKKMV